MKYYFKVNLVRNSIDLPYYSSTRYMYSYTYYKVNLVLFAKHFAGAMCSSGAQITGLSSFQVTRDFAKKEESANRSSLACRPRRKHRRTKPHLDVIQCWPIFTLTHLFSTPPTTRYKRGNPYQRRYLFRIRPIFC